MFNIVLFEPEIPPNTGNIIRLCANTGCALHLIEPLGFELNDKRMQRAGLDYHEFADLNIYSNWQHFMLTNANIRLITLSTRHQRHYTGFSFQKKDYIAFGPETRGLPTDIRKQASIDAQLKIPMRADSRSLNLSNSVAIVVFEAWRQNKFI